MGHYEERLEKDLNAIRDRVRAIGKRIEKALERAVHAVLTHNRVLAAQVILGDLPINREVRAIDALCHGFVARHLPSAGHLRFVSSVLRLNVELERVGDYAVAMAREVQQLSAPPPATLLRDIDLIADQSKLILKQALRAFDERNAEMARGTKAMGRQVESTFQKVFADLLAEGEQGKRPLKDIFAALVIINRLGRVSDQAKNICEETLFAVSGETKEPKVYRILFVDERNDGYSQMAEAYARKVFPDSGRYASAGWRAASALDPGCARFLDENGFDGGDLQPTPLDLPEEELADFHVIVNLEHGQEAPLPGIPFHTVLLDWDVGPAPAGLDRERADALIEQAHKEISTRIRDLMEELRGAEAS
jgi:phosphate transport system protein